VSDLAHRYGSAHRTRRPLVIAVAAVVAAAGTVWLVWAILQHSSPPVQAQLVSYRPAEHSIVARLTVVRSADDVKASCLLRALAADHTVVGELSFTVGSSSPTTTTLERSVRTERRATTVELTGCSAGR
jgi:hypothetical protein